MSGLEWVPNKGAKIGAPVCCSCGTSRVHWWPLFAGWPVQDREGREGCCDLCRVEWDTVWANGGQA